MRLTSRANYRNLLTFISVHAYSVYIGLGPNSYDKLSSQTKNLPLYNTDSYLSSTFLCFQTFTEINMNIPDKLLENYL